MDPLSITVSAIAIIGAVSASINLLRQLKNMPEGLSALLDDLAALRMVLVELEVLMNDPKCQNTIRDSRLPDLVFAAQTSLAEIDEILNTKFLRSKSLESRTKVRRVTAFRHLQRLKELQHALLTIRINLAAMLSVFIAYRSTQIQSSVEDSTRIAKALEESISQGFLDHGSMLQEIHNKMDHTFASLTTSTNSSAAAKSAQLVSRKTQQVSRTHFSCTRTLESEIQGCIRSCICKCHRYTRIYSPELLRKAVGIFFLEYAAFALLGGSCDKRVCRKKSQSIIRATYFFPRWLLLRMISATLWAPDLHAYNFSLKTPRVIPEQSEVFEFARRGDIHGLKFLFEKGLASVHDVGIVTGAPPVTYAIDRNQIATWRFLLDAGADPFQLNHSNQTTTDIAWNKMLANSVPESCKIAIQEDFDSTDYFELRRFPTFHLVILGLVNSDLETQILLSTDPIDSTDWQGRTALSWAAAKGDFKSVEMLLKHGADANIPSLNGSTPLMFASRAPSPSCLKPLLAAGARPNELNAWHVDALDYAMRIESGTRYILPLLQGGADPNLCPPSRSDPLTRAAKSGNPKHLACLIEYGARPRELDGGIFALLQTSIRSGKVKSVLVLCAHFCMDLGQDEKHELLKMAEEVADDLLFKSLREAFKDVPSNNARAPEEANRMESNVFVDAVEWQN